MAAGHRVAARSVLDGREHGGRMAGGEMLRVESWFVGEVRDRLECVDVQSAKRSKVL